MQRSERMAIDPRGYPGEGTTLEVASGLNPPPPYNTRRKPGLTQIFRFIVI